MGTQSSFGGPADQQSLLPKWALLPPDATPNDVPIAPPEPAEPAEPGEGAPTSSPSETPSEPSQPKPTTPSQAVPATWRSAKGRLGTAIKSKGGGNGFRKAGRAYVRALGGNRRAATSARSGRSSTASLGGFLATVAKRGLEVALKTFKLSSLVGKDAETVFAGLVNAIAPEGSTREEIAARDAVAEALCFLYEKLLPDQPDAPSGFEGLTEELVSEALSVSVSSYVYERWLIDLGRKIEEKAISASEAVSLEGEMKQYVKDAVKVDLSKIDVLGMDWKGKDGREFVQRIYEDAYSFIGGSK